MTYDAVVLDMDGVLVENSPEWVFEDAATAALAAFGVDEPSTADVELLNGFPPDLAAAAAHFRERHGVALASLWHRRELLASVNQTRAIRLGEKRPYDDVGVLRRLGAPVAVVSNNQHATVESVVRLCGFERAAPVWYGLEPTLDGVRLRKPDPTYLERAADALEAEEVLYVGDRASDVEAAHNAGADAALLRRPSHTHSVAGVTPTHELESLTGLLDVVPTARGAD